MEGIYILELTHTQKRTKFLVEHSWVFLLLSLTFMSLAFVLGPHSFRYIASTFFIAMIYSVLTLAYWKWEKVRPLNWLLLILALVVVIWGEDFIRDLVFPGSSPSQLGVWAKVQYSSTIAAVFFGVLLVFRPILRRQLYS
jgi:hypothetical protein